MDIGQRLKQVLESRQMSGRALALKVDVVPSQISKIISGTTKPSIDLLQRICEALNITMAEFFTEEEIYNQAADKYIQDLIIYYDESPEKKKAADKLRSMSIEEQRAFARRHVKAGRVAESGVEYVLFSLDETIEQYKSLPSEAQEAIAKVIRLFAADKK